MLLREPAKNNNKMFEISEYAFEKCIKDIQMLSQAKHLGFREKEDMEDKYILILADGSLVSIHVV